MFFDQLVADGYLLPGLRDADAFLGSEFDDGEALLALKTEVELWFIRGDDVGLGFSIQLERGLSGDHGNGGKLL